MNRVFTLLICFSLLVAYGFMAPAVWEVRKQVRARIPAGYVIPSRFSRILALGNKGLLSDYLFLKMTTFIGGRIGSQDLLDDDDLLFVIESLGVVTDLDPYFVDPYVVAEGVLAWDAGRPDLANRLLMKGMEFRTADWRLPFYVGFNYFYFLKDYENAAQYIMSASRLPDSPSYLATLGARLAYYGGKSQVALLFLREMLAESNDPMMQSRLKVRMLALQRAVIIEDALEKYKVKVGKMPANLSDLVLQGFLDELPFDPYGGQWRILKNGRVFSTSNFVKSEQ